MRTTHEDFLTQARTEAIQWARRLSADARGFVILDLETTGLGKTAEICQIGIVDGRGAPLVSTLVKPGIPIEPGATAVTGITDAMVQDAPTFAELETIIRVALHNRHVIVYNLSFDWSRLLDMYGRCCGPHMVPQALSLSCAMKNYAKFHGAWSSRHRSFTWQKLAAACDQMDIPVQNAHDATADCRMTLALVRAMAAAPLPVGLLPGGGESGET